VHGLCLHGLPRSFAQQACDAARVRRRTRDIIAQRATSEPIDQKRVALVVRRAFGLASLHAPTVRGHSFPHVLEVPVRLVFAQGASQVAHRRRRWYKVAHRPRRWDLGRRWSASGAGACALLRACTAASATFTATATHTAFTAATTAARTASILW